MTRFPYVQPEPVERSLCLMLSDDRNMPLQCRFKLGHLDGHDWEIERGILMRDWAEHLLEEQDSPSGLLPVRVPGAALRDASEGLDGSGDADEAPRPLASAFPTVIERWRA